MKKQRTFRKRDLTVCIVLRILVIITIVTQALRGDFENVFLGILTLILFTIPSIIDTKCLRNSNITFHIFSRNFRRDTKLLWNI